MKKRPAHEPSRQFSNPDRLWDDADRHPRSLGCDKCKEKERCGGVHTAAGLLDCFDLCTCADRQSCDMVCRNNPHLFVRRLQEVGGLGFENAPRSQPLPVPSLPRIIPHIDHKYSRTGPLDEPVVAVSLYEMVDLARAKLHVQSRDELAERFLIPASAKIVVSGVGQDPKIERWWELPNRAELLGNLYQLGTTLITAPNYSVFTDVPRTDNLYAMKRSLLVWTEMASAGIPAALHINGRTERDYARWGELIASRPEIDILAFEFATGAGWARRIDWHVEQLSSLAAMVGRPLMLVIRGGGRKLSELRTQFAHVSLIDTDAFAKTLRRRRAYFSDDERLRWRKFPTALGQPLDELLAHNVTSVWASYHTNRPPLPAPRRLSRRPLTPHRDNKTRHPSFLGDLERAGETGAVAPKR